LGDAVGRAVVVGRANAAGGEHIGVAMPERVQRGDDLDLDVGHHTHLFHVDADVGQILGDIADVLVLGAPGQDLVADDQNGGGNDGAFGASLLRTSLLSASRVVHWPTPASLLL